MNRRQFIRLAGGGIVTAAAVSAAGLASVPDVPPEANAPWRQAGTGSESDPRRTILSYAILAPNPHNQQPWLVDLSRPGEIWLYCDRQRLLPVTDPGSRQIVIGHGCFLEMAAIAARSLNVELEITPFPDGAFDAAGVDDRPVARMVLRDGWGNSDPLFAHILARRSVKEPFDLSRPLSADLLQPLDQLTLPPGLTLTSTAQPEQVAGIRSLLADAVRAEALTPAAHAESIRLIRTGRQQIIANPDGIDLGGGKMELLKLLGQLDPAVMLDPQSASFKSMLSKYDALCAATPALFWISSADNGRVSQIAAGRAYLRAALTAVALGLAVHPMSQALQEYPEMQPLQQRLYRATEVDAGRTIQMLARIGWYSASVSPSPRRGVDAIIRA